MFLKNTEHTFLDKFIFNHPILSINTLSNNYGVKELCHTKRYPNIEANYTYWYFDIARKIFIFQNISYYEQLKFLLIWVKHEKVL